MYLPKLHLQWKCKTSTQPRFKGQRRTALPAGPLVLRRGCRSAVASWPSSKYIPVSDACLSVESLLLTSLKSLPPEPSLHNAGAGEDALCNSCNFQVMAVNLQPKSGLASDLQGGGVRFYLWVGREKYLASKRIRAVHTIPVFPQFPNRDHTS
jgi:hypothetical protein